MTKKILIPLPAFDFDPTECSVPWKVLREAGIEVIFATPHGEEAVCDQRMLNGNNLGIFKKVLSAGLEVSIVYQEMKSSPEYKSPVKWSEIDPHIFDGIILPGGHAAGMKEYLESALLHKVVKTFFEADKPVGAICHGVVLAGRSLLDNGKSVLYGRKTTALLNSQELLAWAMTSLWLGSYYRTYPQTVEDEVKSKLSTPKDFIKGPLPLERDKANKLQDGFTVIDGNYISARWPGDAHKFANDFLNLLKQ